MNKTTIKPCCNAACTGHVLADADTGRNIGSFWKVEDAEEIQRKVNSYDELSKEVEQQGLEIMHLSDAVDGLGEHCQDYELQLSSMAMKKDSLIEFIEKLAAMKPTDNLDVKSEAVKVLESVK